MQATYWCKYRCNSFTPPPIQLIIVTDDLCIVYSTLQMLTNIENRLEELFEQIEMMPQEKVEAAEKVGHNSNKSVTMHLYLSFSFHIKQWTFYERN